jgi:hypothetical protein
MCISVGSAHRQDCILDGEVLQWNNETKDLEAFGSNRTAALKQKEASRNLTAQSPSKAAAGGGSGETKTWLCYVIFDILYLKGGEKEAKIIREVHSGATPGCVSGTVCTGCTGCAVCT